MWTDPIVEEVRREREFHAARFDFDVAEICRELRELEAQESGREVLSPPDRPQRQPAA